MQHNLNADQAAAFDPNFWHSYFYAQPSYETLVSLKEKVIASEEIASRYYYPDTAGWTARELVDHDLQRMDHERMLSIWRNAYNYALESRQMSQNQYRAWRSRMGINVPYSYYENETANGVEKGLNQGSFVETDDKPRETSTDEERKLKAYKEDLERASKLGDPRGKPVADRYDTRTSGERSVLGDARTTGGSAASASGLRQGRS